MPPEFCEFGASFDVCLPWIVINCPELLSANGKKLAKKLRYALNYTYLFFCVSNLITSSETSNATKDPTSAICKEVESVSLNAHPNGKLPDESQEDADEVDMTFL